MVGVRLAKARTVEVGRFDVGMVGARTVDARVVETRTFAGRIVRRSKG